MQIQVETFEQNEVVGGKVEDENSPEAFELIHSLKLSGQQKMLSKKEEGETVVRCPYRAMTVKERRVYQALFPRAVELEQYQDSMIPLRVLQVAAHAKELGIYKSIMVWCENIAPRDPVLVGNFRTGDYTEDIHILARWGTALESFDKLFERAKTVLASDFRGRAEKKKMEAERILATIDVSVEEHLNGEWINI